MSECTSCCMPPGATPRRRPLRCWGVIWRQAATAILALLAWLALSSAALAQGQVSTVDKKYVLEWLVAGAGSAMVVFLVIRTANRADKPKEDLDLILREPTS